MGLIGIEGWFGVLQLARVDVLVRTTASSEWCYLSRADSRSQRSDDAGTLGGSLNVGNVAVSWSPSIVNMVTPVRESIVRSCGLLLRD
jgi:hypothetical protein